MFLDAQIFTGFMYVGAALCMWLLRAWMVRERERERKLADKVVGRQRGVLGEGEGEGLGRMISRATTVEKVKGLWVWERV